MSKGRVLVVDDSVVVRAIVRTCLPDFEVQEAGDGQDALDQLQHREFDVVITDLNMPGMDGLGLLQAIKQSRLGPEVIILTGSRAQDVDAAKQALRLGAHDFLTKPPSRAGEVVIAVERAIEKKGLRDANARLVEELKALTRTDALTGLLNRRAFDESLNAEVQRARRYGFPLGMIVLDLDHFKKVNDTYGHQAGDAVLAGFGKVVRGAVRETDLAFRFGGEEFALLLPHTAEAGVVQVAERMVRDCRRRPVVAGRHRVAVTCSAGVATFGPQDGDGADLVARADRALYLAKKKGRDRVVMAEQPLTGRRATAVIPAC